jgi:4-carboxymuconolactone decarboxylase
MTDTPQNPFEAMMAKSMEMAKAFNPALETFQMPGMDKGFPTMSKDVMEMMFGNAFNTGGLDAKTRLFITLAALIMQGAQSEPQVKLTVRHALEAGATEKELAEVVAQMSMFAGVPAMMKGMELVRAAIAETDNEGDA